MNQKNSNSKAINVLVVCLGNICRSPAAQGILEDNIYKRNLNIKVDSAGTAAYHVGNSPDQRSIATLSLRGLDISQQQARQVKLSDFEYFDWILAMDKSNLQDLKSSCPDSLHFKLALFSSFAGANEDVADPYYGADDGFDRMADHLEKLSQSFLDKIEFE